MPGALGQPDNNYVISGVGFEPHQQYDVGQGLRVMWGQLHSGGAGDRSATWAVSHAHTMALL